ncbi:DUF6443 domain-containing protein [Dysgonomonas sp. BGC7]|uniref:DUF6443 domain-containing protein n=1 Tax=Dysgonomonas sp. BGC7 TaxID=1658008 RepID=UPI0012FB5F05|nr:DUF6443 domain-containing protein [Dysgonomonas sp. BGC7]MBD8387937.1 RHS repeat-associated core domain-containing protein [Dysgonomonas sp. BGC7]
MKKKYIYILILFLSIVIRGQSQIILTNPPQIIDLGTVEKDIYSDYELRYITGSPGSLEFTFKLATTTNVFFRIDKVGYLGGASISTLSGTPATYVRGADDPNYIGGSTEPNYKECEYTCYPNSTYKYLVYGMSAEQIAKIKIRGGQYIGSDTNTENSTMNYILTLIPQKEVSSINYSNGTVGNYLDNNDILMNIQYFDGLGRPVQSVQRGITPDTLDLVSIQEYEAFGRESNAWLPGKATASNGAFVSIETAKSYAKSSNGGDLKPYSMPVYEASSLNRVLKQFGPGQDWQNNSKAVTTSYLTNSGTTEVLSCVQYTSSCGINTVITKSGKYAPGELYVTEAKDEDGNTSYEFKDKLGQVVLTRQINNNLSHDTYYIYDNLRNLKMVLPPIASDMVNTDAAQLNADSYVRVNLAYIYQYDNRNRCIAKKLPGCDWIYYVYDKADRLIFTQDGEQYNKSPKEWTFSIPDVFGRVVLTGTCTNNLDYSANPFANIVVKASYNTGRTNPSNSYTVTGVTLSTPTMLSVNFYDGYEFLGITGVPNTADTQYTTEAGYGVCYGDHQAANKYKNKGLLTGALTAQMKSDGSVDPVYLYSVMYYDNRGRVIQTKSNNHLIGGIEKEYIAYNFTGQPTQRKYVHLATGKNTQTEVYAYTYDHARRLTKTTHQLTDGTTVKDQVTLAENSYDEQGRLKANKKNNQTNLNTTYAYNVRSWTSNITNTHFNEALTYSYSGNISSMQWGQAGKNRKYSFTYDDLSRLKASTYTGDGNFNTAYSYDKHGNMMTMQRYGLTAAATYGVIDNLTMTYTGNQMKTVNDAVADIALNTSMDFKDYSNAATEYTYNRNGAMTQDLNKGISSISYNSLNLPLMVDIKNKTTEGRNEYTYLASGQKLKAVQKWNPNYSTTPVIGSTINMAALTQSQTTDYVGNIIYENNTLKRILVDGGYYEAGNYYFYIQDHLGNNRIVTNAAASVVQSTQYYPFGTSFADATAANTQPYKYNGKELDARNGLNMYDYSARWKDDFRFTTIDPRAEKYYSISPYVYCANNPLKYTDPNGDTIRISIYDATAQTINSYYYGADANGDYGFIGANGALYSGNDAFAGSLTTALGKLREKGAGRALVDDLANSTNTVTIGNSNGNGNGAYTNSNEIRWNDANANPYSPRPGFVGLGHEMGHIQAAWNNTTFPGTMPTVNGIKIDDSEIYTTHIENQIRAEHGISLRTHYVYDTNGNGINSTRVINATTSASLFYTQQQTHSATRIVNGSPVVTNTIVNVPFVYRGY